MIRRLVSTAPLLLLVLFACFAPSCSVNTAGDGARPAEPPPAVHTQDPARIGLPPEFRVFFDDLEGEGDWTLIEPYGWCFRPRVNFTAWRPYQDGWWDPSDYYGWIWSTDEPFGWITYHYGTWFYDEYQGWVWQPGAVWGPAWVAWVSVGPFVGWAPLTPARFTAFDRIPGGVFTYASATQLAERGLVDQTMFVTSLPARTEALHMIDNYGRVGGVTINRGPDAQLLAQLGAAIPPHAGSPPPHKVRLPIAPPPNESELLAGTRRLVAVGSNELRIFREQGTPPPASPGRSELPRKVRSSAPAPLPSSPDSARLAPGQDITPPRGAVRDTSERRNVRRKPFRER